MRCVCTILYLSIRNGQHNGNRNQCQANEQQKKQQQQRDKNQKNQTKNKEEKNFKIYHFQNDGS